MLFWLAFAVNLAQPREVSEREVSTEIWCSPTHIPHQTGLWASLRVIVLIVN